MRPSMRAVDEASRLYMLSARNLAESSDELKNRIHRMFSAFTLPPL
jgi:hypothetical protein